MKLWIVPFAVAALAVACIPTKPTLSGSLTCTFPPSGGASLCQAATNLSSKQVTNQTSLCTSMQGTVVAACPAGEVGCCTTPSGSAEIEQCFYGISAADGKMACATKMGTWTAGSGDAGATD
jgi:hypothetical protein